MWNIGIPLFNAMIMAVIFSVLMGGRMGADYGDVPFVLFYFIPFSIWIVFADVIGRSTTILREYSYLVSKIAFPFWVLPLIPLASALINQAVILTIVFVLLQYFNISLAATAPMYLLIAAMTLVLTIGLAYFIAAISAYLPDMSQIMPIALNILFWLTPILYPATMVEQSAPNWVKSIITQANPFYYLAEYSRYALLTGKQIPLEALAIMLSLFILIMMTGFYVFNKLKPGFADVL